MLVLSKNFKDYEQELVKYPTLQTKILKIRPNFTQRFATMP
jgi:hypothetical protein